MENPKLDNTIVKPYFAFCCMSKDPVAVKTELIGTLKELYGPLLNIPNWEELKYHFIVSVVGLSEFWYDCCFSYTAQYDGAEPFIHSLPVYDIESLREFALTPFLLFNTGELDILWHYDTTTLEELNQRLTSWVKNTRRISS